MKDQILREFGFNDQMIGVYLGLLELGKCTITELKQAIKDNLNLSYSQVYHNLTKLLQLRAIEQQSGIENVYTPISPEILLERIRSQKTEEINQTSHELTEIYNRAIKPIGQCTIKTNYFYFSSIELGCKIIGDQMIAKASNNVIFLCCIPFLINRLKSALNQAYENGANIEIHYSNVDFEEFPNFSNILKNEFGNYRVKIVKRKYKIHEAIAVNDEYTRLGHILIDSRTMIDFPYFCESEKNSIVSYGIDYLSGFYKINNLATQILQSLHNNPILNTEEYIPPREALILEYISSHNEVTKSDISRDLNISGTDLKQFINILMKLGKIRIKKIISGKGRPSEIIKIQKS